MPPVVCLICEPSQRLRQEVHLHQILHLAKKGPDPCSSDPTGSMGSTLFSGVVLNTSLSRLAESVRTKHVKSELDGMQPVGELLFGLGAKFLLIGETDIRSRGNFLP